jgi:hypothetical protein
MTDMLLMIIVPGVILLALVADVAALLNWWRRLLAML